MMNNISEKNKQQNDTKKNKKIMNENGRRH